MTNFRRFKQYAIVHEVHDGPATMAALEKCYNEHVGSRYADIVEIFKKQGSVEFLDQYIGEMSI